jgi:hypothetical protein
MRNRHLTLLTAITSLVAVGFFCFPARSQEDKKPAAGAGHDQAAEMQAMMKAAAPGPEHQFLAKMVGDWNAEVKFFQPDGTAMPNTSKGMMHCEMMLDGRFLHMSYEGNVDMGGGPMPFKGAGLAGYDNTKKKYVNVWVDTMSTGMMITEGTRQGDTLTSTGKMSDPTTGKDADVKEVVTRIDDNSHKYELYGAGPDGKMMKFMEIMYTRKT